MRLLAIAIVVEALRLGRRKGINSGVRHGDPSVGGSEAEKLGHRCVDIRDSRISGKIGRGVVLHKVEHAAVEHAAGRPRLERFARHLVTQPARRGGSYACRAVARRRLVTGFISD